MLKMLTKVMFIFKDSCYKKNETSCQRSHCIFPAKVWKSSKEISTFHNLLTGIPEHFVLFLVLLFVYANK